MAADCAVKARRGRQIIGNVVRVRQDLSQTVKPFSGLSVHCGVVQPLLKAGPGVRIERSASAFKHGGLQTIRERLVPKVGSGGSHDLEVRGQQPVKLEEIE